MGDGLNFNRPSSYLVYGVRGSGKSTLLESIGLEYLKNDSHVLDLFGSRDGESLAWLRSPDIENKRVLLLHGDNTDVSCSWDTKPVSQYTLADIENYDLVISSSPLYSDINTEYTQINKVLDLCYRRFEWKKPSYILIREAANLLYSRMKIANDQTLAKAQMVYFIREARHTGFALGVDTLKFTSLDIDIRVTIDFIFIKAPGIQGIPKDLNFLYRWYNPTKLQRMPPDHFILLTRKGSHGFGNFPYLEWHKEEGEPILRKLGIEVEHGEPILESKPDHKVGDFQHVAICELRRDGLSYSNIGKDQNVSSGTAFNHVKKHNRDIERIGACTQCTRAKSDIAREVILDAAVVSGSPQEVVQ